MILCINWNKLKTCSDGTGGGQCDIYIYIFFFLGGGGHEMYIIAS